MTVHRLNTELLQMAMARHEIADHDVMPDDVVLVPASCLRDIKRIYEELSGCQECGHADHGCGLKCDCHFPEEGTPRASIWFEGRKVGHPGNDEPPYDDGPYDQGHPGG